MNRNTYCAFRGKVCHCLSKEKRAELLEDVDDESDDGGGVPPLMQSVLLSPPQC